MWRVYAGCMRTTTGSEPSVSKHLFSRTHLEGNQLRDAIARRRPLGKVFPMSFQCRQRAKVALHASLSARTLSEKKRNALAGDDALDLQFEQNTRGTEN